MPPVPFYFQTLRVRGDEEILFYHVRIIAI